MNAKQKIIISYRNLCKSHEVTNFPRYKDESQMWSSTDVASLPPVFSTYVLTLVQCDAI